MRNRFGMAKNEASCALDASCWWDNTQDPAGTAPTSPYGDGGICLPDDKIWNGACVDCISLGSSVCSLNSHCCDYDSIGRVCDKTGFCRETEEDQCAAPYPTIGWFDEWDTACCTVGSGTPTVYANEYVSVSVHND